ncbi:short-chain oxidoreductase [Aspergillus eucalypticola CBS 122712]|uniref:Short-chain oxidoreductase n=1 Tax=Aspergillus eucalypticola (strain CBS 122712 / IBT 29274) TaxID=1448314 RepID=A0A317V922_ASPEC|nr:short-chain oxidoreductase [Aspergillus eucalypticola CBS 122712]PWY70646.1 short-chain oxidoreductase [Aspergillus eucalypticola CBS 122712]
MAGQQLTWLVTGCSSGLGEALGDKVVATARGSKGVSGTDRPSSLKDAGAAVHELDMASPEEAIKKQAQDIWDKYGPIDVLVNNAGYIDISTFEEMTYTTSSSTPSASTPSAPSPSPPTRALLPHMRARKSGTILFSSSVGTYHATPCAGTYVGPKGMIEGMVPVLATEVAPFNIRVSILTYGHFRTQVMAPGVIQYRNPNRLSEYEDESASWSGNQPGDPRKGAELVVEAVKGEGRCKGMELPLRLPLGSDTFGIVRNTCQDLMRVWDQWYGVTSRTDFE